MLPTLIVDACLNPRLATSLRARGRSATSCQELKVKELKDDPLLWRLHVEPHPWVLVTTDDRMPLDHADTIKHVRATIATLDPRCDPRDESEAWIFEIVHRWAHRMQDQEPHTCFRYSLNRARPWTNRWRGEHG